MSKHYRFIFIQLLVSNKNINLTEENFWIKIKVDRIGSYTLGISYHK